MKKIIIIIAVVVAILATGGFAYYRYVSNPLYSLKQISVAFQEHDITSFEKYVDVPTITSGLLDKTLKDQETRTTPLTQGEALGQKVGRGLINILRTQIEELWRKQIQSLVETGKMPGEDEKLSLDGLWKKNNNIEFSESKVLSYEGKVANVGLFFRHPRFDTTLSLNVLMRDNGSYWQLFDVSDVMDYGKKLDRLEEVRVQKVNKKIGKEVSSILSLQDIHLTPKTIGYYLKSYNFDVSLGIKNIGNKSIEKFAVMGYLVDTDGKRVDRILFGGDAFKPNEIIKKNSTTLGTDTRQEFKAPYSLDISYANIRFVDGTEIRTADMWEPLPESEHEEQ